ncbi:hypothetical protein CQW23_30421 [Capsicum baccatum]|uniref:Ubiquitin-like protease family profile domain-containing protein n=1 Tax=Capsicum baccatum TaxID=33114 RepID=A0A2G2VAL7_CAPBA|nr:hypothetical protein CQW23_30421 [Capsicum baccatum]
MTSSDLSFWKEAVNSEIDSILSNHTWELVDLPPENKPLGSKWICKRKMKADGTIDKYKARLVVKGFKQKEDLDYFDTYLPVTRITSIRMLIVLAAVYDLQIHQMDVKTAFLNRELEEEIYIEQPEGFMDPEKENKNRSKHRNDPVTMKKLTDKAASKSKKSTSKASKKKFDDSGRPRLLKIFTMSIGQISKCLLILEIQQDNKDELHVWVQGEILKFTVLEFAIISGLKCTDNIDHYMYTSSSKSALMSRYFPYNKAAITRSKLITRVQNGNFDNAKDALNLEILFFVHTFMFSQHKEEPISVAHFQIVEDGRYIHFPWGKCIRPKYESFMSGMFTKHSYKNIQPTTDEGSRLDLSFSKDFEICDPTTYASTSDFEKLKRTTVELQQRVGTIAEEFGDFSTIPPWKIFIKDAVDKGEIDVSEIQHHHHVEIDAFLQSHQHKSIPSSSTQPEGTSKSSLGGDEIKNYINKCDVNAVDKDASHEDNFKNQDCSDLQALEDVNLTAKEDVTEVNLKNQNSTDVTDVQDAVDIDKEEKLKYAFDGKETDNHYRVNASGLGYRQLDFVVAYPQSKNWFYLMSERKTCWNDEYLDVIFYHLRKKLKIQLSDNYRYTTTSYFFKTYIEKTHTRYYSVEPAVDLSTQQDYAESIVVAKNEDVIANIIQEFCMPAGLPWYMVGEVYVPINWGKEFHWVLAVIVLKERLIRVYDSLSSKRKKEPPIEIQKLAVMLPTYLSDNGFYDKTEQTDWPSLEAYKGKITQQTDLVNEISFDVDYVQNIPQQASNSLDCGVFVCAYAEILSEGLQVHSCGFDSACQHARYASLLWHYGVEKANEGCTSDYGDPPRPRKSVIEEIKANAIVTLE